MSSTGFSAPKFRSPTHLITEYGRFTGHFYPRDSFGDNAMMNGDDPRQTSTVIAQLDTKLPRGCVAMNHLSQTGRE